ncbi:MAG: hypothetical protein RIC80_07795 [Cyclobacteriaceae bacterium]
MKFNQFSTRVHLPWLTFKFTFINGLMMLAYYTISFNVRFFDEWTDAGSLLIIGALTVIFIVAFFLLRSAVNSTFGIFYNQEVISFEYPLLFHKKTYFWSDFKGFSTSQSLNFNIIIFYLRDGRHLLVSQRSVWNFSDFRYHLGTMPITYLGREKQSFTVGFPKLLRRNFSFD